MAITQVKAGGIAADSIDETKIADNGIDSEHYNDGSIDHEHLANDAVDGDNLADNAVDSEHYTDGSIDHEHLANDAVDADILADNSVGLAAMAHGTDGNLITFDASGAPAYVATGNDGQVLTSAGAGAAPVFETISTTDTLSFRNLIRNGAMNIHQRGGTITATGYLIDGWAYNEDTDGTVEMSQATDGPAGFTKSLKLDVTGTDTSLAGGQNLHVYQNIEGRDCIGLAFGTSDAATVTLSFWVKSNKTGTYSIVLENSAGNRAYVQDYTISSSNTWEKKTITVAGDTSGTWLTTTGIGMRVRFGQCGGSSHTTGTTGSWLAGDMVGSTNMVNLMDSTSNDWYLSGVQLEVGSTATDYEYVPYSYELLRSQRYYLNLDMFYSACMTYTPGSGDHTFTRMNCTFPTTMRANPSGVAGAFACWSWSSASSTSTTTWSFDNGPNNAMLTMVTAHGNCAAPANGPGSGHMVPCRVLNIKFTAEL